MHVVSEPASESTPSAAVDFGGWVRPHWPAMAALARRMSSPGEWEDVLQEALSSAWRKRAQFDAGRGTPRSWLLAIVADQAAKSRRRRRAVTIELVDAAAPAVDDAAVLDLERIIAALPPRQRLASALRYYLGLPLAEIATVMGCTEGTVKSTFGRCAKPDPGRAWGGLPMSVEHEDLRLEELLTRQGARWQASVIPPPLESMLAVAMHDTPRRSRWVWPVAAAVLLLVVPLVTLLVLHRQPHTQPAGPRLGKPLGHAGWSNAVTKAAR